MSSNSPQQDLQRRSLTAVWHPCTQMARAAVVPPLPIARGEGAWLYDFEGRRYFDANSAWWVNLFGHSDAGINGAIKQQLDTLPHVMLAGCTHEPAVRLAERLSARTGGALGHCFFGSDGASAVEIALKQSFHSWRNLGRGEKREFVCLKNGYHGETIGALAVTDVAIFRDAYDPLLMQRPHRALARQPPGQRGRGPGRHARPAGRTPGADRGGDRRAAGAGRCRHGDARAVLPEGAARADARVRCASDCRRNRRRLWPQRHASSPGNRPGADWPDFILLSKGITGGTLPLSLVLTTEAVYQAFWSEDVTRGFLHSHSYTGNALACAAANAVLDRFDAGQLTANREQADLLARAFAPLAQDGRVEHLRQRGMILAFDVKTPGERFSERFHLAARERELLIRPIGATVYLMPPYLIDAPTAQFLFDAVCGTLDETLAHAS